MFGSGITVFFTMRSFKKKSNAEAELAAQTAKSKELENIDSAITTYKIMAEDLKVELKSANDDRIALRDELTESRKERMVVMEEMTKLRKEVAKLTIINKKIFETLDKITPENLEQMVEQLKKLNNG